ncbi:MAG: hypothetical protein EAX95_15710 [Candidatus Thorarchaeota archaeon]|nr:hypothetical protein [Candidatus Thorarchaeota archaeon]
MNEWNDGWFRAVFYPENGGQYARTLWYGEDSYAVTISMWWDPATGQGSIKTSSSDTPYNYLVHAVHNASRVVSSLVIEGLRYGNNPLLEMRIHNIILSADLSRHDPNNPGEEQMYDGTKLAAAAPPPPSGDWTQEVESWWTGPWPELHSQVNKTSQNGARIVFRAKVDLLGVMTSEDFLLTDHENNDIRDLNDSGIVDIALQLTWDNLYVQAGLIAVEFMWRTACYASNLNPGWVFPAFALGLDWLLLYVYYVTIIEIQLRNSGYDSATRFWVLITMGLINAFGWFALDLGAKILGTIIAGGGVTEMLIENLPGAFILLVFKMIALVPLFIAAIYTLTG